VKGVTKLIQVQFSWGSFICWKKQPFGQWKVEQKKRPKHKYNTRKPSIYPIQQQLYLEHHTKCGKCCRRKIEIWAVGI